MRYILYLLCIQLCFPLISYAQDVSKREREIISAKAITELRKGTLIIRFPSHRKKIEALEKMANSNPEKAKNIEDSITELIAQRDREYKELIAAFKANYTFSKVLYMYDYESTRLLDGSRKGIFLSDELKPDPAIAMSTEYFYVLSFGSAGESGVDAYIVHGPDLKEMSRPFPYYFKKNNFWKVLFSVVDSKSDVRADPEKVVKKIQTSFEEYYRKHGALEWQ
jgi:hypothetical protein